MQASIAPTSLAQQTAQLYTTPHSPPSPAEISRGPRAVGKRARNRVIMRGVGHSAKGTPESWAQFFESDRREKT